MGYVMRQFGKIKVSRQGDWITLKGDYDKLEIALWEFKEIIEYLLDIKIGDGKDT